MEENIFNGAKFGDKFLTRDGKVAIYAMKSYLDGKLANWCLVENTSFTWAYDDNGIISSEIDHQFDIVSRYQEPINEDKLVTDYAFETPFEKFCRLPNCIWRLQGRGRAKRIPFHLSLEYFEDNASLDNCTLEYNAYPEFADEECANDCHWTGKFEEVVQQAYQYFKNTSELL